MMMRCVSQQKKQKKKNRRMKAEQLAFGHVMQNAAQFYSRFFYPESDYMSAKRKFDLLSSTAEDTRYFFYTREPQDSAASLPEKFTKQFTILTRN